MKTIKKGIVYFANVEHYELDGAFSDNPSNCGLAICYAIATSEKSKLILMDLEAAHKKTGVETKWHRSYDSRKMFVKIFPNLKDFLGDYGNDKFGYWYLKIEYHGIEVSIIGDRDTNTIAAAYPKEVSLDLTPLLGDVERLTRTFSQET